MKVIKTTVLPSLVDFWRHVDSTQQVRHTPAGPQSDREERLDLRLGQAVKQVLERLIGPEEGDQPVQRQNWDWNDDRTRPVFLLGGAFKPEVVPELRALLEGEFADFRILLLFLDDWDSDLWGGMVVTHDALAVQRAVAQVHQLIS